MPVLQNMKEILTSVSNTFAFWKPPIGLQTAAADFKLSVVTAEAVNDKKVIMRYFNTHSEACKDERSFVNAVTSCPSQRLHDTCHKLLILHLRLNTSLIEAETNLVVMDYTLDW